jgi:hypothetical protein
MQVKGSHCVLAYTLQPSASRAQGAMDVALSNMPGRTKVAPDDIQHAPKLQALGLVHRIGIDNLLNAT